MTPGKPARPTQLYDAIVLGSELPGLIAGALLAKRGLRVLHVAHTSPSDRYADGSFLLPSFPRILPPLRGLDLFHALFEELGSLPSASRALQPIAGGIQLVLPGTRLHLHQPGPARSRELDRAFGARSAALARSLDDAVALGEGSARLFAAPLPLPPLDFVERLRASRFVGRARSQARELPIDRGTALGTALLDLHRFFSQQSGEVPPAAFLRATLPILHEPSRLTGDGLIELLRASIGGHRGDLLGTAEAPVPVEELVLERGRFAGVRLAGREAPHRGRICLASVGDEALLELLPASAARRRFERFAARQSVEERMVTHNLVIREEGIPAGMGELVLVSGLGKAPLLLQLEPTLLDGGTVADGLRTLTATTLVPSGQADPLDDAGLRAILDDVMPFHERHLVHRSPSPLLVPRFAAPGEAASGLEGAPLRTPIPRLLLSDPSVLPGLGLEGALRIGTRAALLAEKQIQKVRPS